MIGGPGPSFYVFITLFQIFWFGTCLANLIAPRYIWRITQGWKAHSEPTKAYFIMSRITGAFFLLFGLFFFYGWRFLH